jgi:hypothetical protein
MKFNFLIKFNQILNKIKLNLLIKFDKLKVLNFLKNIWQVQNTIIRANAILQN